ncbi:MAG: hypothetical protein R3Y56_00340 [Akkermansia sp.]
METILAIGLIAMLLGIFLTLFLPAKDMIRAAIAREESDRIISVLKSEMMTLRKNEQAPASSAKSTDSKFTSGFDKGFSWFKRSVRPGTSIVIYTYRADLSKAPRADGTYPAVKVGRQQPAGSTALISVACPITDPIHRDEFIHAVGPVFLVRMTQLMENNNGTFTLAKRSGVIKEASSPETFVSNEKDDDAWGGVLFFQADFYIMTPPSPARYKRMTWEKMSQPTFTTNMSIRR